MSKPLPRHTVVTAGLICAAVASVAVSAASAASAASATAARTTTTRPATTRAVVRTPVKAPVTTPAKGLGKTPAPVTVSIMASGPVTAKTKFEETLRGVTRRGKTPLAAQLVELVGRSGSSSRWVNVSQKRSAARTGSVVFRVKQTRATEQYRLVVLAAGGRVVAQSVVVTAKRA